MNGLIINTWITGVITLLVGFITSFIPGRGPPVEGPPCREP